MCQNQKKKYLIDNVCNKNHNNKKLKKNINKYNPNKSNLIFFSILKFNKAIVRKNSKKI